MATYYVRKMGGPEIGPEASGLFYWFDGSDAAATDPDAVWTDETNADDSDIGTIAATTTAGNSTLNELFMEGTNAPASGGTISSVDAWFFLGPSNAATGAGMAVWTDTKGEQLYNSNETSPADWHGPLALSTPTGGWTWAKVQSLEAAFWNTDAGDSCHVGALGVMVHTTVEGESTTNPFRTVDEAANSVAAGDTVYVGAGVYREQATMDTSGTSGNIISYIADVDGSQTGDPGLVVVSAYDDEASTAARATCVSLVENEFLLWRGFIFDGGTNAAVVGAGLSSLAYEEVTFEDCVFNSGHLESDMAVNVDLNAGATPTTAGLTFRRNIFCGTVRILYGENATAEVDCKMAFESCIFQPAVSSNNQEGSGLFWDNFGASTYWVGGVSVNNCLFDRCYFGIHADVATTTVATHKITVRNTVFYRCNQAYIGDAESGAGIDSDYNTIIQVNTVDGDVAWGDNDHVEDRTAGLWGGVHDMPLRRFWGWSPFRPYEPISLIDGIDNYYSNVIGGGDSTAAPAFDLYNEVRPAGGQGISVWLGYFDGSDAAASDPGGVWTNETNADDGSTATSATTTTVGSASADYLMIEGTNAPASGGVIQKVETRFNTGATSDVGYQIETDGWGDTITIQSHSNTNGWSPWTEAQVDPPGGWTWAIVQALEMRIWATASPDNADITKMEIRVTHTGRIASDDRGAVEARPQPIQETTTVRTGSNAIELPGAGFHDFLIPVKAQSTTVSVYGRYDSNHTGSLPQLQVLNIDGVADQTDTMVAAANTWEELTATFTPTADGVCRVRVISRDTSIDGLVFFDDLTVT